MLLAPALTWPNQLMQQGWLTAIEGGVFEEEDGLGERRKEAQKFADKRRDMEWRLTHDELYDVGIVATLANAIA